jgi:hypothetical protein
MQFAWNAHFKMCTLLALCTGDTKRRWRVGQWVDVQDAARQWLEGQVREMRGGEVLIHYLD